MEIFIVDAWKYPFKTSTSKWETRGYSTKEEADFEGLKLRIAYLNKKVASKNKGTTKEKFKVQMKKWRTALKTANSQYKDICENKPHLFL